MPTTATIHPPPAVPAAERRRRCNILGVRVDDSPLDESVARNGQRLSTPNAPASDLNALGIVVTELDSSARSKLGLKPGEGVRISRVASLAARQAGLSPGDVILQVGKDSVGSASAFQNALKGVKKGDRVRLLVRNNESTGLVTVPAS